MPRVRQLLLLLLVTAGACVSRTPARARTLYRLDAPLSDSGRTKVLILATEHLRVLGDAFAPALLNPLLERLERFGPDAIAVEVLPPEEIARLVGGAAATPGGTSASLLGAFAGDPARYGRDAQQALGLSSAAAAARAESLLTALPEQDVQGRRSLVLHLLAAYDLPSALLQWSYLRAEERGAGAGITPSVASFLNRRLESPNEVVSIGVALARRRGLGRLLSVDDHLDDEIGLSTGLNERLGHELQGNAAYKELVASSYFEEVQRHLPDAARQGDLLPLYLLINSVEYLDRDLSRQWHLFFRTALPSQNDRVRVALWEARNLRIAGHVRAASARNPGGRILVVIGAAHKPFLDRYLAQMMDIEIVQLGAVPGLEH